MTLPLVLGPGEGPAVDIGTRTRCTFKVTGSDSRGQFGLFEWEMAPGATGARTHIHRRLTELFYVVSGEVELVLGDRRIVAPAGACMHVPENTAHGFANSATHASRMLILFCPADAREEYFRGLAALLRDGRQPALEELVELMERHDQYLVPEPPAESGR